METANPIQLQGRHGKIAALQWGNPLGTPTLALHGWQDNAASFSGLAPYLDSINLVALDLPGHGQSDWKKVASSYVFFDWILDGFAAAEELGWDDFNLIGHSMGAGISSLMGGVLPEKIKRLILIEGLGPLADNPADSPIRIRDSIQTPAPGEFRPSPSMEDAIRRRKQGPGNLSSRSAQTLLERGMREQNGEFHFLHDPRLRGHSPMRFVHEQVQAILAKITAPTLLLRAEDGWPTPEGLMEKRVQAVQDLELVTVPGGHHVHLDHPDSVGPIVAEFLSR